MPYIQGNIVRCDIRIPLELYEKIEQLALSNGSPINAKSGKVTVTPTIISLIQKGLGLSDYLGGNLINDNEEIGQDLAKNLQERLDVHLIMISSLQKQLQAVQDSTTGMNYEELTNYIQNTVKECLSDNSQVVSDNSEEVSDNSQVVSDNSEVSDNSQVVSDNSEVSDTNEEFKTERFELCPQINYERVITKLPKEGDLIRAKVFSKTKKQLTEIRKALDLCLSRYDVEIGLVRENYYSKDKGEKWMLEVKGFETQSIINCLERVKEEFYNDAS
jgi:hypothetical protein